MMYAETNQPLGHCDLRDILLAAISLGPPQIFNIEGLIDRAETGEWGGIWW